MSVAAAAREAAPAPAPAAEPLSHRQVLVVFGGLAVGMLLAALDQTIVATALPTIVGELRGLEHLSWVVTAYLLTSTSSTPLYGKLSDLYGRRLLFQAAIVIFLAGSALCGLAQGMLQLVAFRGLQGLGAGGLMAMSMAIIGDVVAPRQRGRYTGYMGAVFALASVGGPLAGGFFVDHLSWRWVFYVNLPLGAVALAVTARALRVLPRRTVRHRIDAGGAALLVAGVCCLLLVTVWGGSRYPWGSPAIWALGLAGAALLTVFVDHERRAPEPVLPLRLFGNRVFTVGVSMSFLVGCAMFGAIVFLPLFLQAVTGASATNSGLLLVPLMAGIVTTSVLSGRVIVRTGTYRQWPILGTAVAAVGVGLLSRLDADASRAEVSAYMVVVGLGIGMVMQVLVLAVQNAAPFRDLGVATSAPNFFRSLGGAFGVAAFGALFAGRLRAELGRLLPGAGRVDLDALTNGPARIRTLPGPAREAVVEALARSLHSVFLWVVPVAVAAFLLAWMLPQVPLRETVHVGRGPGGEL